MASIPERGLTTQRVLFCCSQMCKPQMCKRSSAVEAIRRCDGEVLRRARAHGPQRAKQGTARPLSQTVVAREASEALGLKRVLQHTCLS